MQNYLRQAMLDQMGGDAPEPWQDEPYVPPEQAPPDLPYDTAPHPPAAMPGDEGGNGGFTAGTIPAGTVPQDSAAPPAPAPTPQGQPEVPATQPAPVVSAPAGNTGAFEGSVRSKILDLMGQDPNAASVNDADLKPVADAHRLALQRADERNRARMAEHYAAQGYGSSGAMDSMIASGLENEAMANASFEAQLVNQKLQDRRQQIMQALQMGAGLLTEDQRLELQAAIANIDAALRNRGMDLQNQQFNDNLGFQIGQWDSILNQNVMNYLNK